MEKNGTNEIDINGFLYFIVRAPGIFIGRRRHRRHRYNNLNNFSFRSTFLYIYKQYNIRFNNQEKKVDNNWTCRIDNITYNRNGN